MKTRQIEDFEHNPEYYIESWINGNKSHVKEEISELFICSSLTAISLINELPKHISAPVINSEQFFNAIIKIRLNTKH